MVGSGETRAQRKEYQERSRTRSVTNDNRSPPTIAEVAPGHPGRFAQGQVPDNIVAAVRLGRITALVKPVGGVRGIVVGDVFKRLVARTAAQQMGPAVQKATAPFQYAVSTRTGCECI